MLMHTAQQAWDDQAEEYDDSLSADEALEIAAADLEATPEFIADWLAAECSGEGKPVNVDAIAHKDALSIAQLLAVIFAGNGQQALVARWLLLERFRAAHAETAQARADELLAAEAA